MNKKIVLFSLLMIAACFPVRIFSCWDDDGNCFQIYPPSSSARDRLTDISKEPFSRQSFEDFRRSWARLQQYENETIGKVGPVHLWSWKRSNMYWKQRCVYADDSLAIVKTIKERDSAELEKTLSVRKFEKYKKHVPKFAPVFYAGVLLVGLCNQRHWYSGLLGNASFELVVCGVACIPFMKAFLDYGAQKDHVFYEGVNTELADIQNVAKDWKDPIIYTPDSEPLNGRVMRLEEAFAADPWFRLYASPYHNDCDSSGGS
ncbi:MAG: hypothetical protein WC707_00350 [Candidatus Babeliaceae bacterium]|jgi:hypothetical protein